MCSAAQLMFLLSMHGATDASACRALLHMTASLRIMLQEDRSKLDERMMRSVKLASRDADAVLVMVDASDRPQQTLAALQPIFDSTDVPKAVILNKAGARPWICAVDP